MRLDTGTWRRLSVDTLAALPEEPAVFEIASLVRTVLYIGAAEGNLRARLGTVLREPGRLPQVAGGYWVRWESVAAEDDVLARRLAAFRDAHHGAVPPGNRENRDPSVVALRPTTSRHAA